jgi:hypothetical protein
MRAARSGGMTLRGLETAMQTVEFRVRPVTRYVVTRYSQSEMGAGPDGQMRYSASLETLGEFDNEEYANEVCRVMGLEAYWAERRGEGNTESSGAQTEAGCSP